MPTVCGFGPGFPLAPSFGRASEQRLASFPPAARRRAAEAGRKGALGRSCRESPVESCLPSVRYVLQEASPDLSLAHWVAANAASSLRKLCRCAFGPRHYARKSEVDHKCGDIHKAGQRDNAVGNQVAPDMVKDGLVAVDAFAAAAVSADLHGRNCFADGEAQSSGQLERRSTWASSRHSKDEHLHSRARSIVEVQGILDTRNTCGAARPAVTAIDSF